MIRRKRNKISCLKDRLGNLVHRKEEIAGLLREGFFALFETSQCFVQRVLWDIPNWSSRLLEEEREVLEEDVTRKEVEVSLWSVKPFKAPGLDGYHAGFYQRNWHIVKDSVVKLVAKFFESGSMPNHLNKTLITLIPKCPGADCLSLFRPISLCNTIYKLVTKVLVNKIRPMLNNLVSPLQTAFVPGRKGMDNMIIVQELIHTMKQKKGKQGYMAIKVDLEKVYDRLEWHFICDMLNMYNIPPKMISLIMSCITGSSISVLFNGGCLEPFLPTRGIRQGDPLSPYLFILCMELLGFLIEDMCANNLWNPLKASNFGPAFSHLFFADDLVLFAKADRKNCQSVRDVLDTFCDLSGQKVNLSKPKFLFSANVDPDSRETFSNLLGISTTHNLGSTWDSPLSLETPPHMILVTFLTKSKLSFKVGKPICFPWQGGLL